MPHTNNPDQRSLLTMYQVRTQGLGSMIAKQDCVQFDGEAIVKAIKVKTEILKKIQHGMITLPF